MLDMEEMHDLNLHTNCTTTVTTYTSSRLISLSSLLSCTVWAPTPLWHYTHPPQATTVGPHSYTHPPQATTLGAHWSVVWLSGTGWLARLE